MKRYVPDDVRVLAPARLLLACFLTLLRTLPRARSDSADGGNDTPSSAVAGRSEQEISVTAERQTGPLQEIFAAIYTAAAAFAGRGSMPIQRY